MARRNTPQRLHTQGSAWGPRRVELGVSIRELADMTGVQKADLSRIESGRMVPSWQEWQKVTAALEGVASKLPAGVPPGVGG